MEVPYLRRFARALTGNPTLSDDLVQDCIERALTRLHLYDETRNIRTWLYTILRNLYINGLRQDIRRGPHMNIDDVSEQNFAQQPVQAEQAVIVHDISKALAQLPDDQREVLVLIAIEELSYEEAANIIGTPIGTVMSRLSRARSRLKIIMSETSDIPARQSK
ncbi:MAG: RNA polymerase sigma factor [Methyloligellaceae bacterium]